MNKRFHRICLYSILTITVSIAVLAQQPAQFSTDRLRTRVTHLASDALEGRRTGTVGAQRAAEYIAKEFKRLGLQPGIQNANGAKSTDKAKSSYLQYFPYVPRHVSPHGGSQIEFI